MSKYFWHGFIGTVLTLITLPVWADTAVTVQAVQNGEVISTMNVAGEVIVTEVKYIGLEGFTEAKKTNVVFSGSDFSPTTAVLLQFSSQPNTFTTTVNATGTWRISVPASSLAAGTHVAYVQTTLNGEMADPYQVAQFTVHTQEALSNSTWTFLLTSALAIVSLLLAITLQIRHNTFKLA